MEKANRNHNPIQLHKPYLIPRSEVCGHCAFRRVDLDGPYDPSPTAKSANGQKTQVEVGCKVAEEWPGVFPQQVDDNSPLLEGKGNNSMLASIGITKEKNTVSPTEKENSKKEKSKK